MIDNILFILHGLWPKTEHEKIWLLLDSFGVSLSIFFFGIDVKKGIDNSFPTIILIFTIVSLMLTIILKIIELVKRWNERNKK